MKIDCLIFCEQIADFPALQFPNFITKYKSRFLKSNIFYLPWQFDKVALQKTTKYVLINILIPLNANVLQGEGLTLKLEPNRWMNFISYLKIFQFYFYLLSSVNFKVIYMWNQKMILIVLKEFIAWGSKCHPGIKWSSCDVN